MDSFSIPHRPQYNPTILDETRTVTSTVMEILLNEDSAANQQSSNLTTSAMSIAGRSHYIGTTVDETPATTVTSSWSIEVLINEDSTVDQRSREQSLNPSSSSSSPIESKKCLVCFKMASSPSQRSSLEDQRLNGIFILKKLLCLPSISLAKYLVKYPERNPDSWISLCGECEEMVSGARRTFEEIVKASRRFKMIQEELVRKVKLSQEKSEEDEPDICDLIYKESRQFVMEYDYGATAQDPCPLGDLQGYEHRRITADQDSAAGRGTGFEVAEEQNAHNDADLAEVLEDDLEPPSSNEESSTESDSESDKVVSSKKPEYQSRKRRRLIEEEGAFLREDGKVNFRCQTAGCHKVYTCKRNYKQHKLRHSGEAPKFPCDHCEKVFTSKPGLYVHRKIIHENRIPTSAEKWRRQCLVKIQCPHCDHAVAKYTLARHIKVVHDKIYRFQCDKCGKGHSNRVKLQSHQAAVHGSCSVEGCEYSIVGNKESLRSHQIQVHGREIDVLACKQCPILLVGRNNLRKHQIGHASK